MNKFKICVYAICKNEENHIARWYESMKEADDIYVLDTGSTDNSVNLLKKLGVNVKSKKYDVFKFDEARNDSLEMVPLDADICVCTDIDEVFSKGWRNELEKIWDASISRVKYNLNFSFDNFGNPIMTYYISKIHNRTDYKWIYSIHEVLKYIGKKEENVVISETIQINHFPDRRKDRSFYLSLLENEALNNSSDDRILHYLGREYMYIGEWNKSIDTLIKHIYLETSYWDEEKSCSMRFISRCYKELKRYDEAIMWLNKSILLTPNIREPYVEMGILCYELNRYDEAITYLLKALEIKEKTKGHINEEFAWNETIYDILSLCYYYIGDTDKSIINVIKALEINPNNERIKNNLNIIESSK